MSPGETFYIRLNVCLSLSLSLSLYTFDAGESRGEAETANLPAIQHHAAVATFRPIWLCLHLTRICEKGGSIGLVAGLT
jgi:hypothetical protein